MNELRAPLWLLLSNGGPITVSDAIRFGLVGIPGYESCIPAYSTADLARGACSGVMQHYPTAHVVGIETDAELKMFFTRLRDTCNLYLMIDGRVNSATGSPYVIPG
ncbi:hypothetical protein FTUN_6797 [Frigoriglobus tundricola]|uniref:Uncharacterized protein n=1 Tax=Frigoriglobus tundricola TaxID=2774151 RepID=A0A6M5YYK2_9BACT|nr:hypothetical protein FTUN_6797 [Frigoriglobus tundricola]